MNKHPAYLLVLIILVILSVVFYRYNEYVVKKNFYIDSTISCDPSVESCFAWDCSSDEDPECDDSPYKKVSMVSNIAPNCLEEHACESFSCPENSGDSCVVISCSEETLSDGEICAEAPEAESEDRIIEASEETSEITENE
jgi:hypothetical protein